MRFKRWCRNCNCEQEIKPILGYEESWRKLYWLLEFLRLEGTIEEATFEEYINHLMFFKGMAFEADEKIEEEEEEEGDR